MPNRTAAPPAPETRFLANSSAATILARSRMRHSFSGIAFPCRISSRRGTPVPSLSGNSNSINAMTKTTAPIIKPPFTLETARAKVQAAEDAWNSRDPERVALAYTPDSEWRNRTEFLHGREQIKDFLRRKWARENGHRLKKTLWAFTADRIAVIFEYESHDSSGQWSRSYGNELWEFDEAGLMKRRLASINDAPIAESERRVP